MRIFQLLPVIAFGDAVGNDTRALKNALIEAGYETEIYADVVDSRLPKETAQRYDMMPKLEKDDVIIYHLSTGHKMNSMLEKYPCRKIIMYHNVTPARYFAGYNRDGYENCRQGIRAAKMMKDVAEFCFADSQYNKEELISYGYKCDVEVLPILIPFEDYKKEPNKKTVKKFSDGKTNILFTGRIVPNKKQEDLITSFYYYNRFINKESRLILAGSYAGMEKYRDQLIRYAEELGIEDNVFFSGMSKFDDILAYYTVADVFLSMSEHEGFCVPLVEAMCFKIPVIARDTSAIAGTLGGSGILLPDNNPMVAAEMINRVVTDEKLKKDIIHNQDIRLKDFDNRIIQKQFLDTMKEFVDKRK